VGRSDPIIQNFYKSNIKPEGKAALLGFTENRWFEGDLYDLQLGNWDINSDWELGQKYDTIISLRCPYFAKDPEDFVRRCHSHLNPGGYLYADWGLGDHWRFDNYKIGWCKDGEQEYAYKNDNFLWSTVWDDSFLEDERFKLFSSRVKKFNYDDVKKAIFGEVPSILQLNDIKRSFDISYNILTLWEDKPQIYFFIKGVRNG
tara:strand:+ start:2874 stop:3479 length:606 start_codon:yes stop_codon:yes gene_type:complete